MSKTFKDQKKYNKKHYFEDEDFAVEKPRNNRNERQERRKQKEVFIEKDDINPFM